MIDNFLSGNVFNYPIVSGEHLYDIYQDLNNIFKLTIDKDNYKDSIVEIGLDGLPTLTVRNNENIPVYIFVNRSIKETNPIRVKLDIKPILTKNDSSFLSFNSELDIFENKTINEPIYYSYANNEFLRKLKNLLINYGYGNYPIITDSYPQLNGVKILYYGSGMNLEDDIPYLKQCNLVTKLAIPLKEGYEIIYLKTG